MRRLDFSKGFNTVSCNTISEKLKCELDKWIVKWKTG